MDDDVDFLAWQYLLFIYLFCGRGIDGQEVFKLSDDENKWFNELKKVDVDNKKQGAINVMIYFMMRKF